MMVRKLGPYAWRLTVYEGEDLMCVANLRPVVDIRGESDLEWGRPLPTDVAQQCLLAVVGGLRGYGHIGHPIQSLAAPCSAMTVCVEHLESIDSSCGQLIARLDVMMEESHARGSLLVANQPRIDLDAVVVNRSDGVLDVVVRLLQYMLA